MFRIITTVSALALTAAVPAMAQDTVPGGPTSGGPTSGTPNTAPMQESTPPASEPAPAAPAADPAVAKAAAVKEIVDAEFPTYDADKSSDLNKSEFTKWVSTLKEKSDSAQGKTEAMAPAAMTKWATDAFAAADKDKSKKVSKDEMTKFLQG